MMMMMMREANRTRDAMIELSFPPPQKTDTNTRVESAQQQQKEQKRTHTMTVRLLICVFSRGRCICNISADLIKNHTTSKRLFCTVCLNVLQNPKHARAAVLPSRFRCSSG